MTDTRVAVDLGERSYDIVIAPHVLVNLDKHIAPLLKRDRTFIITDENVAKYHLNTSTEALSEAGIASDVITLPAGEATKSYSQFENLMDQLLALGVERSDTLIALGGGVVGDITGFAAATLRRGVDFIQVPTSLLAQVDSSVGGKTGINSKLGKNLIGAFHQPRGVFIDIDVLNTLPERELQAGYAEVLKYGLIDDIDFFEWLEANGKDLLDGNKTARIHAIARSCRAKARIVAEDEFESGKRALLNLGHTFGHALEAELKYDGRLLHGEAVAIGMVMALDASAELGLANGQEKVRLVHHLQSVGMKAFASEIDGDLATDTLFAHMAQDKKVEGGVTAFILGSIGKAEIVKNAPETVIKGALERSLSGQ